MALRIAMALSDALLLVLRDAVGDAECSALAVELLHTRALLVRGAERDALVLAELD